MFHECLQVLTRMFHGAFVGFPMVDISKVFAVHMSLQKEELFVSFVLSPYSLSLDGALIDFNTDILQFS